MRSFKFWMLLALNFSVILPIYAANSNDADGEYDSHRPKKKIYTIADDVILTPTANVQYDKPRIIVKAVYPVISSGTPDENIDSFNLLITDLIRQEAENFREKVLANQAAQINYPKDKVKNEIDIDFNTSVVNTEDDPIISIRFSIQGNIVGLAHPYHTHHTLNYNLYNGEEVHLASLFKQDADYLTMISSYCRNVLNKRLKDKGMIEKGTAALEENFKNWNVSPYGLLITFDEAQVAPYVYGTQTVMIPYSVLKLILAPDSFTSQCTKHRRSCIQNNVLTGGFIDEAANTPTPLVKTA